MMTDPIGNMLAEIRNAILVTKDQMQLPLSKEKQRIAEILKREGFIDDVEVVEGTKPKLKLSLRYAGKAPAIRGLRRVSKPGRRVYVQTKDVPFVMGGQGIGVLNTNRGILTDREARKLGVGGELICEVW
jgi:small subunit ribosomal protein S8